MATYDYSHTLAPRRGKTSTMTSTKKDIVLRSGEIFIEYPNTGLGTSGAYSIKIGDGTTTYENLPYAFCGDASTNIVNYTDDASTTVAEALANAASGNQLSAIIPGLKQAIALVDSKAIYSMTVDGNEIEVSNNAVSFDSPDYTIGVEGVVGGGAELTLSPESGYNKEESTVNIVGSGAVTVSVDNSNLTIGHTTSGVTAGTFNKSVTVDAQGHITNGTNLSFTADKMLVSNGSGDDIVAASTTKTYIDSVYANAIEVGPNGEKLPINVIPAAAIEDVVVVADDTARLALTSDDVQKGDVVKVNSTGLMYFVVDESKLGTEAAFMEFVAGHAASVEWANIDDFPAVFTNAGVPLDFTGCTSSANGTQGFVPAPSQSDTIKYLANDGTWSDISFDFGDEG